MREPSPNKDRAFTLWTLRRYLRPYWPQLAGAGSLMTARAVFLLFAPWPLKLILDSVILGKPLPHWAAHFLPDPHLHRFALLEHLGIALLLVGVADATLAYLGNRLLLLAGQRTVFDVRRDLFAHIQRLSLSFHRRQRAGDLMARLGGDIQTLQNFVVGVGTGVFAHVLTMAGMVAIMLMIDWRYALVVFAVAPVLLLIVQNYATRLTKALRLARRKEGELWSKVQEVIANVHMVQAYCRESHEDDRFTEQAGLSLAATLEASELQSQFTPLVSLVMALATGAVVWYGAVQVLAGKITAGDLLVFLAYLRGLATPVRQIAKMAGVVGKSSVAAERIGDLFNQESEIREPASPHEPAACKGRVEFRSVRFGYHPGEAVLDDISFCAEPGQTIALVGSTGAGKSTLVSLISRFYDPTAGQILLDGQDLRNMPLAFVRNQVALVPQEVLVFHGSVWENIAYGRPGAGREDAIAAARAAGIDDRIARFPNGYDTVVGERGMTLSGGQRQCLSIARAMLRNAPIVILDEPTTGLDAGTESLVAEALRRLTRNRTTFVIAHRLATVTSADRILVLERGRIVQTGSHNQLLRETGRYRELWTSAFGEAHAGSSTESMQENMSWPEQPDDATLTRA
jgi:ATP-binding cassette subfamily B protein/subfamily B ATP-binding cassette protein MsbA